MSAAVRDAVTAIQARLERIHTANGYNTTAGLRVNQVERSADPEAGALLPRLSILTGSESTERLTHGRYRCRREIWVDGAIDDADEPVASLEALIEDVQQALEQPDETLGGLVHSFEYVGLDAPLYRDDGSEYTLMRVRYEIEYDRNYGA